MNELPPDDPHQTITLGGETAVLVPLDEYLRFRDVELEAGRTAAGTRSGKRSADGAGEPGMTMDEVREYLDLAQPLSRD